MLDYFTVFHRGGAILWKKVLTTLGSSLEVPVLAVNSLIQQVLLEERLAQSSYEYKNYTLKWSFENDLGIVFVAVYLNISQLLYIDELLEALKKEFISTFRHSIPQILSNYPFDEQFTVILEDFESKSLLSKAPKAQKFFPTSLKAEEQAGLGGKKNLTKEEKKRLKAKKAAERAARDGVEIKTPTRKKNEKIKQKKLNMKKKKKL